MGVGTYQSAGNVHPGVADGVVVQPFGLGEAEQTVVRDVHIGLSGGSCVWLYSGVDELWWLVVLMRGIRDDVSVMHVTACYCRVHSYIPHRNMFTPAIAV